MKNLSVIIILIASLLLAVFFFWQYKATQSDLALANQRMTDRDTQIYKQAKEIETLKNQASGKVISGNQDTIKLETPPSAQFADELGSLSESDIARLENKGLENPEVDLKNDLLKKPNYPPRSRESYPPSRACGHFRTTSGWDQAQADRPTKQRHSRLHSSLCQSGFGRSRYSLPQWRN